MAFRPEFKEAIELLARAITIAVSKGASRPVLVGGAAVELYTGGAVASGDFDLVATDETLLAAALEAVGFQPRVGASYQWVHPASEMAVELVSGPLMGGKTDRARIYVFEVGADRLYVIPIEDLIADRLGQAYSALPPRKDLIDQARKLYELGEAIDRDYLNGRIVEETVNQADIGFFEP